MSEDLPPPALGLPAALLRRNYFSYVAIGLLLLLAPSPTRALPSGEEVLQRVRAARAGIRDYTVDVQIRVDMEGVKVPEAAVRVYHKAPDKTKLLPLRGFAILPKGTFFLGDPFAGLGKHFSVDVLGAEFYAGRPTYRIQLKPKTDAPDQVIEAQVDRERWNVLRLTSQLPSGDPVTLEIHYQRVQNTFWLPSRSVAHIKLPDLGPTKDATGSGVRLAGQKGTVTVTFRAYKVNTGLPDSLFRPSETQSSKRHPRRKRWKE